MHGIPHLQIKRSVGCQCAKRQPHYILDHELYTALLTAQVLVLAQLLFQSLFLCSTLYI
jgi:hypothetical protein